MNIKHQKILALILASTLSACGSGTNAQSATQSNSASRAFGGVTLTGTSSDPCSGVPAWNSATAYATAGTLVVQDGIEYKNNWWTQGNNPTTNNGGAGTGQPWTKQAVCGTPTPTPTPTPSPSPSPSPTPAPTPTPSPSPAPTPVPGDYPLYNTSGKNNYTGGTIVRGTDGNLYQCLSNIVAPWCNSSAAWAYAPGTGSAWNQAWQLVTSPTPTPTPTPSPSPSPTPAPTPTPTPSPSPSPTPTPPTPVTGLVYSAYKDVGINANWNNLQISTKVQNNSASFPSSLVSVLPSTSMNTISWAFATGECGQENWAGMNAAQFASQNIADFNNAGLKYIVSTGGASGTFTCSTQAGMDAFLNRYMSKGFVGLDFDIEGGPSGTDLQNLINMIAYAQQKYPTLRISFTLATLASANPSGTSLNSLGDSVITKAKAAGINFYVNLMVMDYGNSAAVCVMNAAGTNCDMNLSAQQAAKNLSKYYNIPLSNIELTPMIGVNDTTSNIVSLANATSIASWSKANGLAGVHYWSFDRDASCVNAYATTTCSSSVNGVPMQTSALQYLNAFASGL